MILDKKVSIFITIVECGSFSEAARLLSLSQSVISFHIDSLEKEIGISLFKRHGRKIEISEIGRRFYQKLKKVDVNIKAIKDELSFYSQEIAKKIYFSGNSYTCAFTLPIALSLFNESFPGTKYSFNYKEQEQIVRDLLSGKDDFAFVGHKIINKKIINTECMKDEIVLVSKNNNYPKNLSLEKIKAIPLVWIKGDIGLELILKKELQRVGIPLNSLNIFMELEDLALTKGFIRSGCVVAFLPKITVMDELEHGVFKVLNIPDLDIFRTTYYSFLKENIPRPIINSFLEFIKNENWEKKIIRR